MELASTQNNFFLGIHLKEKISIMPLLSIIIPAYNAAKHIDRCLGSIVESIKETNQDLPIEIIVVNDGSSDNTAEKVNGYKSQLDEKLIFINKSNSGVSSARNCGLKNARGEYFYFMDSDDAITLNFFHTLLPKLAAGSSELIVFGFSLIENGKMKTIIPRCSSNLLKDYLMGKRRIAIWSIVSHKRLFRDIVFDENTYYGEDVEVISKILLNAHGVEIIKDALYMYYFDNPSSAMHKKISERNLTSLAAHKRVFEYMVEHGAPTYTINAAKNLMLTVYYYWKQRIYLSKDPVLKQKYDDFVDLEKIVPPFQLSKFYLFNVVNYCKLGIFHFKRE